MLASQWLTQKVIQKSLSFGKKTAVNIWHLWSSQQADIRQCVTPSHTSQVLGTMCWRTLPKYHHVMPWYKDPICSQGELRTLENFPKQKGRNQSHLEMVWPPDQRGDPGIHSCWWEETVQWTFFSARGTELFKVLGALNFLKVPGALMSHSTTGHGVVSGQIRKAFHFFLLLPHSLSGLGHYSLN